MIPSSLERRKLLPAGFIIKISSDDGIRFVTEYILDYKRRNNMDNEITMKEQEISENKSQITNQIF